MNTNSVVISENPFVLGSFLESDWNTLLDVLKRQFNYDNARLESFRENRLLKLVAAIPFVANCENPYRTAIVHLSTMIIASEAGKDIFLHNFKDNSSLEKRLFSISHFDGGNQEIIKKGMNLLSLVMLSDHKIDCEGDLNSNKYNPINSNVWSHEKLMSKLLKECNSLPKSQLDDILSAEEATKVPWEIG